MPAKAYAVIGSSSSLTQSAHLAYNLGMTSGLNSRKLRRPKFVFGTLVFISLAVMLYAWFIRTSNGVAFYKILRPSNGYTSEQSAVVGSWLSDTSGFYLILLVVTNVLWMVGARYLLFCLKQKDEPRA